MDTMKLFLSLVTAAVVGIGSVDKPTDNKVNETATVLVAEWPTVTETPAASPFESSNADELRQIAEYLKGDVAKIKQAPEEQRKAVDGFASYRPKVDSPASCECTCDCPDEDRFRVILREELAAALRTRMQSDASTSAASAGGSVAAAPVVSSSGSSGAQSTVVSSTGYYESQPVTYYSAPVYSQPTTRSTTYTGPLGVTRTRTYSSPKTCRIVNGRRVCN
jgi:hypothetical protein